MNAVAHPLLLNLAETDAHGRAIAIDVAGYEIRGRVELVGASLDLRGHDGAVSAERLEIANVTICGHGVRIGAQQLAATHCTIGWGSSGLRVEAASFDLHSVQVIADAPREGALVLQGISLAEITYNRDEVRIGRARIAHGELDAKRASRTDGSAAPHEPRGHLVDHVLAALDRLTGHVNVDLGLDLTVPVIGSRQATHEFRIPIDGGTIDFRKLESNLSTLEDSLLDFSVRDEGLVLEVGIPFLPTRGRGKPIVTWQLSPKDHELAEQQRVRLSVLAHPEQNGHSEPATEDKPSRIALRRASAGKLDIALALAPAEDSPLRTLGSLVVAGDATVSTEDGTQALRAMTTAVQIEDLHVVLRESVQADDALAQLREVASDARI